MKRPVSKMILQFFRKIKIFNYDSLVSINNAHYCLYITSNVEIVEKPKVKAKTSEIKTIEEDLDEEFKNIDREIDSMSSEANLED